MNTYTTGNNTVINVTGSGSGYTIGGISSQPVGTITLNGAGSSGQYFTTGSNGSTWATTNTTFNNGNGSTLMSIPYGEDKIVLDEKATLEVKGNVKINGIDLEERLRTIEKVLMIPERDAIMEAKYPSLKKKYDEYINALGKYRTFEAIKGKDE